MDCKFFLLVRRLGAGSGPPWGGLRRLLGISVAPQVGSIFNQAMRDNTAKRWSGVPARRTTESDTPNHHRYWVTGKSLDAAGCTGEPAGHSQKRFLHLALLHGSGDAF